MYIYTNSGRPFKHKFSAASKAKRLGPDYEVVEVDGGYAVRAKTKARVDKPAEQDIQVVDVQDDHEMAEEYADDELYVEDVEEVHPYASAQPMQRQTSLPGPDEPDDVQYFSEREKGAYLPGYYFENQIEDLRDQIQVLKKRIKDGLVPPTNMFAAKEELKKMQRRLRDIEGSKPILKGKTKDQVYREYKYLEEKIKEGLLTHEDMQKGISGPHEELKRATTPYIEWQGRKISRNEAARLYKIRGYVLGENTNIERIREPGNLAPGVIRLPQWKL